MVALTSESLRGPAYNFASQFAASVTTCTYHASLVSKAVSRTAMVLADPLKSADKTAGDLEEVAGQFRGKCVTCDQQ